MGATSSKSERASIASPNLDLQKSPAVLSGQHVRNCGDGATHQNHPLGVKLKWLLTHLHTSRYAEKGSTVGQIVENFAQQPPAGGRASSPDALGPATYVVLVHPSTPWSHFIRAMLNHVRVDLKRMLLAPEAPLSPRSPLIPLSSNTSVHQGTVGKAAGDGEAATSHPAPWWLNETVAGSPDSAFNTTCIHINLLESGVCPLQGGASVWCTGDDSPLSQMANPAALLVIDPAGAVFSDPRALRGITGAMTVLQQHALHSSVGAASHPAAASDGASPAIPAGPGTGGGEPNLPSSPAFPQPAEGPAPPAASSDRTPRLLQLASGLSSGDWAAAAAAFGRLAAVAAAAAAKIAAAGGGPLSLPAVVRGLLEAARAQHLTYLPLFTLYTSHCSFSVDLDCGGLSPEEERSLLPQGQQTDRRANGVAGSTGGQPASTPLPPRLRGDGPGSQSGVAKFVRDAGTGSSSTGGVRSGSPARRAAAPSVPPTDPETLSSARSGASMVGAGQLEGAGAAGPPQHLSQPRRQPQPHEHQRRRPPARSNTCGSSVASSVRQAMAFAPGTGFGGGGECGGGGALSSPVSSCPTAASRFPISGTVPLSGVGRCSVGGGLQHPHGGSCGGRLHASTVAALHELAAGTASAVSCSCTDTLVPFAVEAVRRYAALLEAVGQWAMAQDALEGCVTAAGERWGHRSGHVAAVLSQLGRLQRLQGLYGEAEITWRQVLEAYECSHGPSSPHTLMAQVELARVLAALGHPEAEAQLRSAMASLDSLLGPTAPETLLARVALGELLSGARRWMEAEVTYQALLQAQEVAAPPHAAPAGVGLGAAVGVDGSFGSELGLLWGGNAGRGARAGAGVVQSSLHRSASQRSLSQQLVRQTSRQQLMATAAGAPAAMAGTDGMSAAAAGNAVASGPPGRGQGKWSDSRGRTAWDTLPDVFGQASGGEASSPGSALPPSLVVNLPPLRHSPQLSQQPGGSSLASAGGPSPGGSAAVTSAETTAAASSPRPLAYSPSAASATSGAPLGPVSAPRRRRSLGFGPGPGGDPVAWSGTAAALADVVAALHRECGGVNSLYAGMHLAGPEGTTAADLAAAAAVCPRSGACIAAVVNVRRVTDAEALYDAALAARCSALGPAHPAVLDLQLQYARHLSAAGDHTGAEGVCRAALESLPLGGLLAPQTAEPSVPASSGAGGAAAAANQHPAEVSVRHTLGAVLLAAGSFSAATAALSVAVSLAERLVEAGDMAAADARRIEALDSLAEVYRCRAMASTEAVASAVSSAGADGAGRSYLSRAAETKRQAIELISLVYGEHSERTMRSWVALGQVLETAGDLAGAERAFESAAEAALHRHSRLSAATKAIFRQLQRVYQAQGRTADAQVLGHMYRLKGGLLSSSSQA